MLACEMAADLSTLFESSRLPFISTNGLENVIFKMYS